MRHASTASKLHRKVCSLLVETFGNFIVHQEYNVGDVNPEYGTRRHHFDIALPQLKLVIECHGIQHTQFTTFGGDAEEALMAFRSGKRRDKAKMEACLEAGWNYVVVSYTREKYIDSDELWELYQVALREQKDYNGEEIVIRPPEPDSREVEYRRIRNERAALYRRERYQRAKEFKEEWKERLKA